MVGQLSIESMVGIDYDRPKMAQIEQWLLDHIGEPKSVSTLFGNVMLEVDGCTLRIRPELRRIESDTLEWFVKVKNVDKDDEPSFARSDEELIHAISVELGGISVWRRE